MEDKILSIIKTDKIFLQGHSEDAAHKITMMMTSFITWLYVRCHQFVLKDKDKAIFYNIDDKTTWTLEEVFIYWDDNIFNKQPDNEITRTKFNHN
jgi:hypothetical protein